MYFNELIYYIKNSQIIKLGFCENKWVWFHMLAGLFFYNLFIALDVLTIFFFFPVVNVFLASIVNTFIIAILWEFVEFFIENNGEWKNVEKNYGSIEKWKYDTAGDIFGVVLIILIEVLL